MGSEEYSKRRIIRSVRVGFSNQYHLYRKKVTNYSLERIKKSLTGLDCPISMSHEIFPMLLEDRNKTKPVGKKITQIPDGPESQIPGKVVPVDGGKNRIVDDLFNKGMTNKTK